jgi:hypothetical protein
MAALVHYALVGGWNLSAAEKRVWDAFSDRTLADLGNGANDLEDAKKWGADRVVRGAVIAALLLGAKRPEAGRVPAVRLAGARIEGSIDVSDGDVTAPLLLNRCYLDCEPTFDDATCRQVRLDGCVLPGFSGRRLQVRGSLHFGSCQVRGPIVLRNARLQGSLHLGDAHLEAAGQDALSAGGIQVDGALFARRLHAEGTLRLIGGTFNGGVFIEDARLRCPGGHTITGDGMTVRSIVDLNRTVHAGTLSLRGAHIDSLSLEEAVLNDAGGCALHADHLEVATYLRGTGGLTAEGEICLNDAHIGTVLDFTGASLHNPGGSALAAMGLRADAMMNCCEGFESIGQIQLYHARIGHHLCFEGARLSNPGGVAIWAEQLQARELMLQTAQPPDGTVDLRGAQVGVLHDDPAVWPTALRLEGLDYDSLDPPLTAGQRLSWLNRDLAGYVPGAYGQLSAMYRRLGHGEQARVIQLAKQRRRRQTLPPAARAWSYLQDWTVGYGYRPGRAAAGLLLLWAIGSLAFSLHHPPPAVGADPRTFQPIIYTLGLLLPVIDFQQEDTFTPQGAQSWLAFLLIAAGWILTTTVAAAIVRGLRGERE